MIEAGIELWRLGGPTLLLHPSHPEQAAQNRVLLAFEYLQGQRFHSLSVLSHTYSEKNLFWCFREPPVF